MLATRQSLIHKWPPIIFAQLSTKDSLLLTSSAALTRLDEALVHKAMVGDDNTDPSKEGLSFVLARKQDVDLFTNIVLDSDVDAKKKIKQ